MNNTISMFSEFPDLLSVEDLQKALGIGRTMAYRLINSGEIKHLRIGKSIKIPKRYLIDFVLSSCYNNHCSNGQSILSNEGGR